MLLKMPVVTSDLEGLQDAAQCGEREMMPNAVRDVTPQSQILR